MELVGSSEFSDFVEKLISRQNVVGLAIGVVQNGKIVSRSFGKAALDTLTDFTPDTLICVGSATKSLTAAAVSQLVHDNENYPEVQYESKMANLLPEDFVMPGTEHVDVTVEDILSHRTGMPPHEFAIFGSKAKEADDSRSITRNLRNLTPVAANRSDFIYCNMMYIVASHLIETKSTTNLSSFLENKIFKPLHMSSTCLLLKGVQAKGLDSRVAAGYIWDKTAREHIRVQTKEEPETQGAGQIYSCINDYAKWIKAMIHHEGPITKDVYQGLTGKRMRQDPPTDENLSEEQLTYYALGWDVRSYGGYTLISHDGGDPGYQCNQFFIPQLQFGGVIFSNSDHANDVISQLTFLLIDEAIRGGGIRKLKLDITEGKVYDSSDEEDDGEDANSEADSEAAFNGELEKQIYEELCPGVTNRQNPQKLPLSAYTGQYWNPGYRGIKIEETAEGHLFVDATDRSLAFTLAFKHVCDQTKYILRQSITSPTGNKSHDEVNLLKGEFELDAQSRATRLGLQLEERLDGYIWFDKINK